MNVIKTISKKIIITRFDEIPLLSLLTPNGTQLIINRYNFEQAGIVPSEGVGAISFQLGQFQHEDGLQIVAKLEIQERKIVIEMEGEKSHVDEFHRSLSTVLAEIAGKSDMESYLEPVLITYESSIIVRLGFHYSLLFAQPYLQLMDTLMDEEAPKWVAMPRLQPSAIRFQVDYAPHDPHFLSDYRIGLTRKEFLLEPRFGYPLHERVYHSSAPLDTETHIEMLKRLESAFGAKED